MRYLIILTFILLTTLDTYSQCLPHGLPKFSAEIIARSSGNELDEPLIAGEEVFVSISFNTNRDSTARLLHGLIPTFGPGWNHDKIDFDTFHAVFGQHIPTWFSTHDDCPPYVVKDIPTLCTYVDVNGILQLCNLECETCPCTEGLKKDDILPSGWFWNFQPVDGCNYFGECLLPMSWGPWGIYISHNGWLVNLDILLTVANYSNLDSCEVRNDLSIGIQEIYDDITGCWTSEEERASVKFFSENWIVDCTQPPVTKTFNKLKFIVYHDENLDGIKNDDEDLITYLTNFDLVGDSISGYSEALQYYFLTGNEYQAVCDTTNFLLDFALSTQSIIDVNFNDGIEEKEVEFGVYRKPTSVNNQALDKEIIAYPNPVSSKLTIELPQEKHLIKLTNSSGSIIYQKEVYSSTHSIDTNKFPAGLYYLSIYGENYTLIDLQKIIKD